MKRFVNKSVEKISLTDKSVNPIPKADLSSFSKQLYADETASIDTDEFLSELNLKFNSNLKFYLRHCDEVYPVKSIIVQDGYLILEAVDGNNNPTY